MIPSFYRLTYEHTVLAWKRMLPGLSDTVIALVIGGVALQVASVVLIFLLAFNIALGSFATLLMMHLKATSDREPVLTVMLRAAGIVALGIVCLAIVALLIFPAEIGVQSFVFLLLCLPRPLLVIWNVYHREILFKANQHGVVQKLTSRSVLLYVGVTWGLFGLAMVTGMTLSLFLLLSGVYAASLYIAAYSWAAVAPVDRLTIRQIKDAGRSPPWRPTKVTGVGAAVSNSATNVLEIGFLAVIGWVVVGFFPDIATYYYPMFNMFEWASALAIGLSRVFTDHRIEGTETPSTTWVFAILALYSFAFVALYLKVSVMISPSLAGFGTTLYMFAVCYVFFDGLQLVLRSYMLAQETGGKLLQLSLAAYTLAFGVIVANWLHFANPNLVFGGLLLPLVVSTALLTLLSPDRPRRSKNV